MRNRDSEPTTPASDPKQLPATQDQHLTDPKQLPADQGQHLTDPKQRPAAQDQHLTDPKQRPAAQDQHLTDPKQHPAAQDQRLAEQVTELLYAQDKASQALGIRILEVRKGYAKLAMVVRPDMTNGHRICHGGMVFTLADSAFAFACNACNENTVAAAASIDFLAPSYEGDELTAVADEVWRTRRNGIYEITVTNQKGARIALFRGRSARIEGHVVKVD